MAELAVNETDVPLLADQIIQDYRLAYQSRQASLIGRREVMSGKAKFGIFGDGKEVIQIAMSHVFQSGDFRSGYYRDQTLMFALGLLTFTEFFAQLYAHTDVQAEPATAGRAMNAHFATRSLDPDGNWKNLSERVNSSADVSPTAAQMPRLVGLAYASRLYRELPELQRFQQFSHHGDEIAFGTIGNASCAEGLFWESINAIGVLKAPALVTIYDDGYGISVTNEYQVTKGNLSALLQGFQRPVDSLEGFDLYQVRGWDYPGLIQTYQQAAETVRREHVPAIIHVTEVTQPQGHSTSGSQERYKSKERLAWEQEFDCLVQFRQWILDKNIVTEQELKAGEDEDRQYVEDQRRTAWEAYLTPIRQDRRKVIKMIDRILAHSSQAERLTTIKEKLSSNPLPLRRNIYAAVLEALQTVRNEAIPEKQALIDWKRDQYQSNYDRYDSFLYSENKDSALRVPVVAAIYAQEPPYVNGFEVLNACFNAALSRDPRILAFGEDVGRLGDVNQGFKGLQEKFGKLRVSDTGIRETTIVGQAIGLAMRGLRPIAEIQYLDYLLYALQTISDDLATLLWRTRGGQKAPVIIRTRGHRLEGIWHSGSLMASIIHLVRGMHVLVPRNMTQAAGFYNTLFQAEEPALVVEVLNGYRMKEKLPKNVGEFTIPLGAPEVLRSGDDLTLVTYGACCRIALEAGERLSQVGIETEVIDVQTLLPFDLHGRILESLKKTGHILFVDEDVPGGTTAYMFQEVIEKQGGYSWLDSPPKTLAGKQHRPAYGSDGDYWSKPSVETIFEAAYDLMHEVDPATYPNFYRNTDL